MVNLNNMEDIVCTHSIDINRLVLKKETIQNALGYETNKAPDYVTREIDLAFDDLAALNDIRGGYRILYERKFSPLENGFRLDDTFFHTGTAIASNLQNCEYIAFILATAGNVISEKIKESNRSRNYMRAFVYDIVGSAIAECAGDLIQYMVEENVKTSGFSTTHCYSPGHCGWDVREQYTLFSFLPENFCHITLTKSALMVPVKSLSGIIGIGEKTEKGKHGCTLCTMATCYKKRQKQFQES